MTDRVHNYGGSSKISVQGIREARTATNTSQSPFGVIGDVKCLAFGKEVVYARVTTAVSVGQLCQGPAAVANHGVRAVTITASIGATEVTVSLGATAAAKDAYKDSLLLVGSGTGSGYSYMIAGHASAAASAALKLILKDGLEAALNTASLCTLLKNRCNGVGPTTDCAAQTGPVVGVALCSAPASYLVYLGKKGEWPVDAEGTWVVGCQLGAGSAAGTVMPVAAVTDEVVGVARATPSASGYGICDFNL